MRVGKHSRLLVGRLSAFDKKTVQVAVMFEKTNLLIAENVGGLDTYGLIWTCQGMSWHV